MFHPDVCRPFQPKPSRPNKNAEDRRPPVCARPQPEEPLTFVTLRK